MSDLAPDEYVYQRIADDLRRMIESGEIPPHYPLPSIRQLQETYGVADQTARKAVRVLVAEGLAHTVMGKGTFAGP
jgi:GntR family transcriptional regulator